MLNCLDKTGIVECDYFKCTIGSVPLCTFCVAVLQVQNKLYESQKLTLYLYINIEVFLGYGNSLERTATLQQLQQFFVKIFRNEKNIAEK